MKKNILIYTKTSGIYGSGHFVRMKILMHYIKDSLNIDTAFIIESDDNENTATLKNAGETLYFNEIKKEETLLIIVDKRESDKSVIRYFKTIAPVMIIDSIGNERELADIVVNMLPSVSENDDNNVNIPPYTLTILNTSKLKKSENKKVLIYLGECERSQEKMLDIIKDIDCEFVFVLGNNLEKTLKKEDYKNVIFVSYGETIFDYYYSHVITYYGLTAFEAVSNFIFTALYPITDYHKALSKKCSDIFFVIEDSGLAVLKDEPDKPDKLKEEIEYFLSEKSNDEKSLFIKSVKKINTENSLAVFKKIISHIENFNNITCTACKNEDYVLVHRNKESNLYLCKKCKTLFRKYFLDITDITDITEEKENDFYGEDYFENDYKKQYGKTYKEDKENLSCLARERIKKLKKIKPFANVLDLGSAMGFFIKECENSGYSAKGVEISKYAYDYSKSIGLNVSNCSLLDFDYEENKYDIITMWYVLEHIENLDTVINKIKYALKDGGLLALAMPSSFGFTGRFNKEHYYSIVPSDHSTEFCVGSIDIFLKSYGFEKVMSENKSVYIDRMLKKFNIDYKILKTKPFRKLYSFIARVFNLGDTFECIYSFKKK